MKFGKVENLEGIDFTLPPDDESNMDTLHPHSDTCTCYIGATGWSMKDWKGKVYPPKAKASEFLFHYSRQFNSIELNSTHYTLPKPELINKWKNQVTDDFRFCPKVWQQVSHRKDLGIESGNLDRFIDSIVSLEERLGACFLQLPPYFSIERLALLESFIHMWPDEIPLAIEARHESFYTSDTWKDYIALLRAHKIIPLITDVAGRRDILHSSLSREVTMIRWVGNGLHKSDYSRLEEWVKRLNKWKKSGIKEIYFFPHEPDNLLTPEISKFFVEKLKETSDINTRGPRLDDGNKQLSLL
ncbi:MAG: DUF72 domain-containing protein [Saprospiraceae bacterium]|nr:DUF72 domain-containing protein [Saprospiraceae bacterium]